MNQTAKLKLPATCKHKYDLQISKQIQYNVSSRKFQAISQINNNLPHDLMLEWIQLTLTIGMIGLFLYVWLTKKNDAPKPALKSFLTQDIQTDNTEVETMIDIRRSFVHAAPQNVIGELLNKSQMQQDMKPMQTIYTTTDWMTLYTWSSWEPITKQMCTAFRYPTDRWRLVNKIKVIWGRTGDIAHG
ncbi:hypothetical protein MAR_023095 [Mya arenaria]|uniref:ATP synthase F0 subunit 8 n=1 Tax=Mya arenaria TaxID=6604 RepID=A0ABY7DM33_MYAAR|nr:hypothetical protein MAR_023095 [Mya arenaria]